MKYRADIDRWISKDGLIYRYDKRLDKLVLCGQSKTNKGYMCCRVKNKPSVRVHRVVWETFNGPIPDGMQIDHKNNNRTDNRLNNLQIVTCSENNKLKFERGYIMHDNKRKDKFSVRSEFGERFIACYGERNIRKDKDPLYQREHTYFRKHGYLKGELNV